MLPSLGALPLAPTGAQDDVVTEIRAEQRAQAAVAAVRAEVLDNRDLVKEIVAALDRGGSSWEACKLATRLCSLNRERRAACDEDFWHELITHIWGDFPHQHWSEYAHGRDRFRRMCVLEHKFFTGERSIQSDASYFNDVKRFVLAEIAKEPYTAHQLLLKVSSRLQDDEDVVRAAVARDPREILWASPRLQALLGPVLRPTIYWPKKNPTDFERKFGEPLLHLLMLHGTDIGEPELQRVKMMLYGQVSYMQQQSLYPEFDAPMWYAWTPEDSQKLADLLYALKQHLIVQIPALAAENS